MCSQQSTAAFVHWSLPYEHMLTLRNPYDMKMMIVSVAYEEALSCYILFVSDVSKGRTGMQMIYATLIFPTDTCATS